MSDTFVGGLALSQSFFTDVVTPLLREALGQTPYAAALTGYGSEVQGFDRSRSADHASS